MSFCMIDPGHGPGDGSKAGRTPEHKYCWDMACFVESALRDDLPMTRHEGEDPDNPERFRRAVEAEAGFVISLHVNAGPSDYHGAHAFPTPGDMLSHRVAEAIMSAWPKELSRTSMHGKWKGTTWIEGAVAAPKKDYWPRVHSVHEAFVGMPLVLVEMYYGTNAIEDELAHQDSFKEEMAFALCRGVLVGERQLAALSCGS